jgi:hypothetical protein
MNMSTTPENRFAVNRTVSNRSGVTLMNNQVGTVVARVMKDKPGVNVMELPSMIRVDGPEKIDFDFEEIAEALGWQTSAPTTSRRSCPPTTAAWSSSTTAS